MKVKFSLQLVTSVKAKSGSSNLLELIPILYQFLSGVTSKDCKAVAKQGIWITLNLFISLNRENLYEL